jgi:dynein heavy chain 2
MNISWLLLLLLTLYSLNTVYEQIMESVLQPLKRGSISARTVSSAMLEVYKRTQAKFKPSILMHYVFTPRDLTNWAIGIARCDPNSTALVSVANSVILSEGGQVLYWEIP